MNLYDNTGVLRASVAFGASPTNGTILAASAVLVMEAGAADGDGTIAQVRLFANGQPLATLPAGPSSSR